MSAVAPRISVILVTYHTGDELFRSIDSVLTQSVTVELLVVDNGNPSSVILALQNRAAGDPRLRLITGHGNVGFSSANNLGVAQATGDHVLILNPDSILAPDALLKFQQTLQDLPRLSVVGPRILNEDGTDQRGSRRELLTPTTAFVEALHLQSLFPSLRLNRHETALPAAVTSIPAISGACMFLSRESFSSIGGFDEGYFLHVEDLDFCFRFRRAGGEIYFAPEICITHIGATSDVSSDFIERHKARGFIRYFHRNFGKTYPLLFLWGLDIAIWLRYILRRLMHTGKK